MFFLLFVRFLFLFVRLFIFCSSVRLFYSFLRLYSVHIALVLLDVVRGYRRGALPRLRSMPFPAGSVVCQSARGSRVDQT